MQILPEEVTQTYKSPIQLFYEGLTENATRIEYVNKLKKVLCEYLALVLKGDPVKIENQKKNPSTQKRGIKRKFFDADFEDRAKELVELTRKDPEKVESIFLTLIKKFKERTTLQKIDPFYLSPNTISNYLKPVQKLFKMNNVPFSWHRINNAVPDEEIYLDYEEYSRNDIKRMLERADVVTSAVILLWSSSGIRAGAFDFNWKHIRPVYHYKGKLYWEDGEVTEEIQKQGTVSCAFIQIYADSKRWAYYGFVTPECWKAIQAYREDWIRKFKTEPKPEDPFFVNMRKDRIETIQLNAIRMRLERLLRKAGIKSERPELSRRYKKPTFNAFRYFFNKQNKNSNSKNGILSSLILKETMMGHTGLIRLDRHYFREHAHELIEEYLQSVPNLTISNEERSKLKVLELRRENSQRDQEFKLMELRVQELEKKEQLRKEKTSEIKQVTKTIEELEEELRMLKNFPQTS